MKRQEAYRDHLGNNQQMNIQMQSFITQQQPQQQQPPQPMSGRGFVRSQGRSTQMQQSHLPHHHHPNHHHHTQAQQQPQQQQVQQISLQQSQQIRIPISNTTMAHNPAAGYNTQMMYFPFQYYNPYPAPVSHRLPSAAIPYSQQFISYPPRPIASNVNQNPQYVTASNEYTAPPIAEQIPQTFVGTSKPSVPQPVAQQERAKRRAIIQDPNTGHVFNEQELQNTAEPAPTSSAKVAEEERASPSAASTSAMSSHAALEFQNRVSLLALSDTKTAELDSNAEKVIETETLVNNETVKKENAVVEKEEEKKAIIHNESDSKTSSISVSEVSSCSNDDIKEDKTNDLIKEKANDEMKSGENQQQQQSHSAVLKTNEATAIAADTESKKVSSMNEKTEFKRSPSPVISASPSPTLSTPSSSSAKVVIEKEETMDTVPVKNQPNGDIDESTVEKIQNIKECKNIIDEVKLKEDDKEISNVTNGSKSITNIKESEKLMKIEDLSTQMTKLLPPSSNSSSASKDEIDNSKQEVIKPQQQSEITVDKAMPVEKILNETKPQQTVKTDENSVESDKINSSTSSAANTPTANVNVVKKLPQASDVASKAEDKTLTLRKNSGKFEYESSFLRKLQNAPASLVKPKTLPNLEIIQDSPICSRPSVENRPPNTSDVFFPNFVSMPNQNRNQPRNISMRSSQGRSNSQQDRPRKIISPSLTQDVKLHTAENAWKPKAEETSNLKDNDLFDQKLTKAFRGILNKLTPEKYEKLLLQVKNLQIDTVHRLELILRLIFEKAVDEPAFCLQYAHLCKHLCETLKVEVKDENGDVKTVQFSHLLVTKCQQEFESKMYDGIDVEGRRKEISQETEVDKRKVMFDELDDEMRKARKRSLGNIKLIGELYKLGTIKCFVMIICVKKLLADGEEAEESLECLCTLLRTIGPQLEKDIAVAAEQKRINPNTLSQYFTMLDNMAKNDKTSSRVRFMIQDIIDLRSDGWKERKVQKENKPKTINELRQEAQEEENKMLRLQQQQALQQMQQPPPHSFQRRQDSMKKENLGRKSQLGGTQQTIQAFKQIGKSNPSEPTLGPSSMGSWGKGAGGGGSQQKTTNTSSMPANRFTLLSDTNRGGRNSQSKEMNKSQVKEGLMKKSDGHPSGPPPFGNASIRQMGGRASSSKENASRTEPNSRNASITKESPSDDSMKKSLSEEEVERIAMNLINEYISNKNFEEVGEDLKASLANEQLIKFVSTAVNHLLEVTSQTEQNDVGMLFQHLLKRKTLTIDYLRKGLEPLLEIADDIVVDVPKFWDYNANIFAPVFLHIENDDDRKTFFIETTKIAKGVNKAGKLMSLLVKRAVELSSKEKVLELWSMSELKWSDFLNKNEDEKSFIENNNLSFTESSNRSIVDKKLFGEIEKQVELQVSEEKLIDFILEKFSEDVHSTSDFVSALFKSVVKGCLNKFEDNRTTYSVDEKKLKSRCTLLSKFCNNDSKKEIDALFALQQLAEELQHPSKMLNQVFATLHDQYVISQDAFLEWETSDQVAPGKAMAVLNAKQFLTWLKESEDQESDA